MTLYEFLHKHVPDNAIIKVIWPERNRTITGRRPEFRTEARLLETHVFDFQISNGLNGYNCLIWVTSDKDNLILEL